MSAQRRAEDAAAARNEGRALLGRFFREFLRPYWALQVEIGACFLVGVLLTIADPLLLRVIIDRALGDGDGSLLALLILVLLGVLAFRVAFRLIGVWLTSYSGLRVLFDLRQRAFEHVQSLSPYYFRGERFGDVLARVTTDVDVLHNAAAQTLVNAAQDSLLLFGILAALVWLDPGLALLLVLLVPVLLVALRSINRRLRREGHAARGAIGALYAFLEERLGAVRLVQEHRREKAEAVAHVRVSRPWIRHNLRLSLFGAIQVSIADLATTGALMLVFLWGGLRAIRGEISLGSLVAFYTLAARIYRPVSGLVDLNIDLQVAIASLRRVFALLDVEPQVREAPDATVPAAVRGAVQVAGAGLVLDGQRILRDVGLTIAPGEVVGLVGPSGSGKSTLAALLSRTLDPSEGTVALDGLDLRRWKLSRLRDAVGLVPQETQLFHDTLEANLRFARPDATRAELLDVLRAVQLEALVERLPEGLETPLGEGGMRLSGGERQRLALARALLKHPAFLILDEATSALDPLTERLVLERFLARLAGSTVLLVAHRLTTLTDVDRIFVLDQGRLVEHGTHPELMTRSGLYRTLFDEQLRRLAQA